jgi:GT2 family glycosyltransferase
MQPPNLRRMTHEGTADSGAREQVSRRISVVVLTYNRCHLLRQCVENVLMRTSERTTEIVIWNNGSKDETANYLEGLTDPRIVVVQHPTNIGVNAYSRAFRATSGDYLIEVDDDVVDAPPGWDETLLQAFERLPNIGYLAANLVNNPHDVTAQVMYGIQAHLYRIDEVNGVRLKVGGPVGGGCSLTSRELHDRVGGWSERSEAFWEEEGVFLAGLSRLGYGIAYLEDLRVEHHGGPYYSRTPPEKLAYWRSYNRVVARKDAIKRTLLRVPSVRGLNARFGLFQPPRHRPDYVSLYTDSEAGGGDSSNDTIGAHT